MKKNYFKKLSFTIMTCGFLLFLPRCQKKDSERSETKVTQTQNGTNFKTNGEPTSKALANCTGSGVNHFITKEVGKKMIDKYHLAIKKRTIAGMVTTAGWNFSETFTGDDVRALLAQENCCNFRIYYGLGIDDDKIHAILVGVSPTGFDIFSYLSSPTNSELPPPPIILETAIPCPRICDGVYTGG